MIPRVLMELREARTKLTNLINELNPSADEQELYSLVLDARAFIERVSGAVGESHSVTQINVAPCSDSDGTEY